MLAHKLSDNAQFGLPCLNNGGVSHGRLRSEPPLLKHFGGALQESCEHSPDDCLPAMVHFEYPGNKGCLALVSGRDTSVTTLQRTKLKRLEALLKQQCPRCLEGSIFVGWVTTREACPACGLRFGREEGYFSGGMDLSFFLAVPVLAFIFLVLNQLFSTTLNLVTTLFLSYAVFLPCAVPLFRYSRALWLYIDWQLDPVYDVKPAPLPPIERQSWWVPAPNRPWTHDSLFALAQRLATLIEPSFDRALPRREVEPIEGCERAAWGTEHFGLLGERALPLPGETIRRHQAFSAYGLPRGQRLIVTQEYEQTSREPRVIIEAGATSAALDQIDQVLVSTYGAVSLLPRSVQEPTVA